jgi:membrane fusion protein
MPTMPLFRAESQAARAEAWLGRVVLVRPLSFAVLTAVAVALAIGLAVFFLVEDYTRKARVVGTLAPADGVVRVVAQLNGRVQDLGVAEGRIVARDVVLLAVVDDRAHDARPAADAIATQIGERRRALVRQRELAWTAMEAEQASLAQRLGGLERERAQLEHEINAQASRAGVATRALARMRRLEDQGFVSPLALDRETDAAMEQDARLEALHRSRIALARDRASLEHEIAAARARARAQVAALESQAAQLEQERIEREMQHRIDIIAPTPGTVATVLVEPGQAVSTGTTLATIIPAGAPLQAHLYAPSRAIGFVRPGQEVQVRYPAYPHQKFGAHRGRVASVSRNAVTPAELGFTPPDGSREPLYRIKVELPAQTIDAYGRPEPLKAGMQVEADILLDRRRLIEWIFEPLLSLSGRA